MASSEAERIVEMKIAMVCMFGSAFGGGLMLGTKALGAPDWASFAMGVCGYFLASISMFAVLMLTEIDLIKKGKK